MQEHMPRGSRAELVMIIVYNSGMASGDAKLQTSWRSDVEYILDQNLLTIFTCASDKLDLANEVKLMKRLGACYQLYPRKNAFAALTTYHPEGKREDTTNANAFIYAVQGRNNKPHEPP
jgi:hypothetical protein